MATAPMIGTRDCKILRRLASRVAELAARPMEQEKRTLWYRHNALEPTRPLIFCDPENGWNEIIAPRQLECEGEFARQWEMALREEIFWGTKMCDDRVVAPYFNVTRPSDLDATEGRLPVVAWANGGCVRSEFTWQPLFDRWASAGFVVLALTEAPDGPFMTTKVEHGELIDWAIAQNEDESSPYHNKLASSAS